MECVNGEALLPQSVWTVPPICRLEESFGNTGSKISINTCDVASFVNITGMELMIKANVRLDTHSCFRKKKTTKILHKGPLYQTVIKSLKHLSVLTPAFML